MKSNRNMVLAIVGVILCFAFARQYLSSPGPELAIEMPFSEVVGKVEAGKVREVEIAGYSLKGRTQDGNSFRSFLPYQDNTFVERLLANRVTVSAKPLMRGGPSLLDIFLSWFPTFIFMSIWFYMSGMRFRGSANKSRQRKTPEDVKFADIGGLHEAKEELVEVVDFLKNPEKYTAIGAKIPRGILLVGKPGNGKTYLAKAVSGEANVPFFYMSGSSFVEMYVGVGAARVRELFNKAASAAPALIFIDEIDAVGGARGSGSDGANKEFERTLNELLVAMDGFSSKTNVIVIAATNRDDTLDSALMRRFERKIFVHSPDKQERVEILEILTRKMKVSEKVNLEIIARRMAGSSAADLKTTLNEAGLIAARQGDSIIEETHINEAIDRLFLGLEKRSSIMSEEEKWLTAYHESGHAIAAYYLENSKQIHKVTIVPRGHALGMVAQLPGENIHMTLKQIKTDLVVAAAGRAAELIKYGKDKSTTGASSDIKYATNLAEHMFVHWGFSDELGPVNYDMGQGKAFTVSDHTKETIASEVRKCLQWAQSEAIRVLTEHSDKFELLAQTLMRVETLTGEQVRLLFETGTLELLAGSELGPQDHISDTHNDDSSNDNGDSSTVHAIAPNTQD